jgi:sugar lactone lactonase YvrE
VLTVLAGLGSRKYPDALPHFLAEYFGDTVWALMVFLLLGLVFPRATTARLATSALAVAYLDELTQLYHAPWIDSIRDTRLGGLILGQGFLWSDLVCYAAGIGVGAAGEWLAARRARPAVSAIAVILALLFLASNALSLTNRELKVTFEREWGKQGSAPGDFHFPIGIAINDRDEIFVADHYNDRVQKFDRNGRLLAVIPVLFNPGGIAVADSGEIYLTHFPASRFHPEKTPDRVSVYSPEGVFLREWGRTGKGDGELDFSGGLAVTKDEVYVADQTNRRVQVFERSGRFLRKWGEYGAGLAQFGGTSNPKSRVGGPQFVAIDRDRNVYTTEASPPRVQKFSPTGRFLLSWGDPQDQRGGFGRAATGTGLQGPIAICIDRVGRIWVSAAGGRVQCFSPGGRLLASIGEQQGSEPGMFIAPHGVATDSRGDLYVVDAFNHRIQKYRVREVGSGGSKR